ncbi:hypothetical protein CALVIDRAFT_501904 [Calocera viscosa TUFC12733]|uniref:Endoplasmic reticulum junction formation protein lunapark n=1 Tax=Calocera viscosa (strain TUFC12733) TaxID=1330018 RepID=A0A167K5K2_CALVF|nr:hypothetical protein CALVIDRAFT_501904 [Calocera viscosa TUFC12733]
MGNLFSKKSDDYENALSKLAESIDTKKAQLADIRLRERRATLLFTLYSLLLWIVYTGAWYLELLPGSWGRTRVLKVLRALPVGAVPVIIFFIRRLVHTFYSWRASSEEARLKSLLVEQKAKIAEIKKKTNYDSTRNLLEKYGETSARPEVQPSPLRQRGPPGALPGTQPSTPLRQMGTPVIGTPNRGVPRPLPPYLQPSGSNLPPPQTRKWYDTLADALLGPDEQAASREKYALICAKCFNHNGLVSPAEWDDVQYKCPRCGHFNPSRRSLRMGQNALSPTTPATPLSSAGPRPVEAVDSPGQQTAPGPSDIRPSTATEADVGNAEASRNKPTEQESADQSMMDIDTPTRT